LRVAHAINSRAINFQTINFQTINPHTGWPSVGIDEQWVGLGRQTVARSPIKPLRFCFLRLV